MHLTVRGGKTQGPVTAWPHAYGSTASAHNPIVLARTPRPLTSQGRFHSLFVFYSLKEARHHSFHRVCPHPHLVLLKTRKDPTELGRDFTHSPLSTLSWGNISRDEIGLGWRSLSSSCRLRCFAFFCTFCHIISHPAEITRTFFSGTQKIFCFVKCTYNVN